MVRRERIVTNDATAGEVDATALDAEIAAERASGGSDHAAAVSRGIMRAAVIITLGNVFSRLLGFARDLLTAVLFGASVQTDGYFTALRVQTSIYDLLVSGVISAAFIPVFSAIRDDDARFRSALAAVIPDDPAPIIQARGSEAIRNASHVVDYNLHPTRPPHPRPTHRLRSQLDPPFARDGRDS